MGFVFVQKKSKATKTLQAGLMGASMAASQIVLAGNGGCTVANSGHCSACGGCVVALVGLAGWAVWRGNGAADSGADL